MALWNFFEMFNHLHHLVGGFYLRDFVNPNEIYISDFVRIWCHVVCGEVGKKQLFKQNHLKGNSQSSSAAPLLTVSSRVGGAPETWEREITHCHFLFRSCWISPNFYHNLPCHMCPSFTSFPIKNFLVRPDPHC